MKRVLVCVALLVATCVFATARTAGATGDPSGQSPPGAPPGYDQVYSEEFLGSSLDSNWYAYSGQPGGDPANCWAPSHVAVSGGEVKLSTYQDPSNFCGTAGDTPWVSGGIGTIASMSPYGEVVVRSRVTSMVGVTQVELLWPAAPVWPPEIDFNESWGAVGGTSATLHYNSDNEQISDDVSVDLTQWHTWGVIWTPGELQYTVDGTVWATMTTANVPDIAMVLDIQQQYWSGAETPHTNTTLDVDWVAAYQTS